MKNKKTYFYVLPVVLLIVFIAFAFKSGKSNNCDFHRFDDSNKIMVVYDVKDFNDSLFEFEDIDGLDSFDHLYNLDSIINITVFNALDSFDIKLNGFENAFDFEDFNIQIDALKDSIGMKKFKIAFSKEWLDSIKANVQVSKHRIKQLKDSLKTIQKDIIVKVKTDMKNIDVEKVHKEKVNFLEMTDSEIRQHFKENDPGLNDEDIIIERSGKDIKIMIKKEK